MMKKFNLILVLLGIITMSCSNDDDNTPPVIETEFTITELAATNNSLTTLVAALQRTGLDATLNASGTFTVFAPTNQAFTDAGITSLDDFTDEELTNILLNHVLGIEVLSSSLSTGYVNTLSEGPNDETISLYVNTEGGITFNGVASPVAGNFDVEATNGIIHVVDAVLTIPTVVDHALSNSNFSTLVTALSRFGTTYTDLLSGSTGAPFTVFAPTNQAFDDLLKGLGFTDLASVPDETLEAILTYHVIIGSNVQSGDLTDGLAPATASSDQTLEIDLEGSIPQIIDASPFPADIIATDVQGGNGVIHAIDKVILPESIATALGGFNIAAYTVFGDDFSILGEALEAADLFETVRDTDGLTVFAPTNASFEAFLSANGFSSLDDIPSDILTQTLLYHVIGAVAESGDLTTSYIETLAEEPTTMNNINMYINTENGVVVNGGSGNGGATIVTADVMATNGVIHIPNAVIALPTVVTFAIADSTFETLVTALTRETSFTFVETLSSADSDPDPFTVFAPTNDAFGDLLEELTLASLNDIPTATLEATLNMHVVAETNVLSTDLSDNLTVSTLGGDIIANVSGGATLTDANERVSDIVVVDVQAWNGAIHVINKVILPAP